MNRDHEVDRLVGELEDKFETYMADAAADFFRRPDVIAVAEKLSDHGVSEPIDLWPDPLIAQVAERNGRPVWTWRERQDEDDDDELDGTFDEDDEEDSPEFGDHRGDFQFLKGLNISRKGIFTQLNDALAKARKEREEERKGAGEEEAEAWEEEFSEPQAVKKDERELAQIVESIGDTAAKFDFLERVLLFYLLRHKRCQDIRKLGVKFTGLDIMRSIDDVEFKKKIRRYAELIAGSPEPQNKYLLLIFESHIDLAKKASATLRK